MTMTRREKLFENGVQFGHQTRSWCPKMKRYLWGEKDGVHLINVEMTDLQISKAEKMLEEIATKGLPILWVGTKRVAREAIVRCAQETSSPYFSERWIGGTLTNYVEVKKAVTNMLYNKEMLEKADRQIYTKKELGTLQKKIEKAEKNIGGIERLAQRPGVLIVVGVKEEGVALREAQKMGIPVVALVDTNCDPTGISVVIPGNDDRENSISLILGYLSEAVKRGREVFLQANPLVEQEEKDTQKKSSHKRQHSQQRSPRPAESGAKDQKSSATSTETKAEKVADLSDKAQEESVPKKRTATKVSVESEKASQKRPASPKYVASSPSTKKAAATPVKKTAPKKTSANESK